MTRDIEKRIERLESLLQAEPIKFRLYNGVPAEISTKELTGLLTKLCRGESIENDSAASLLLQADEDSFDVARDGSITLMLIQLIRSREAIDPEDAKVVEMLSEIVNGKDSTEVQ